MNILITGAGGQLGSELGALSLGSQDRYILTDAAELDILDREAIRALVSREQIDVIINCAAYTQVDRAETDTDLCDKLNHRAPESLAIVAREAGALLIHVSTDYVFAGDGHRPYRESDEASPLGVYGLTKRAGELAILGTGCRHIIIRTSWLYSSYGANFVKTMRRLQTERPMLSVVSDQVGSPTYARDLARAIIHIIQTRQLDRQGIYHYSGQGVASWYDFSVAISELSGNTCAIRPCTSAEYPTPARRPHYSVLDKDLICETFGIEIPHWRASLAECIHILNENEPNDLQA